MRTAGTFTGTPQDVVNGLGSTALGSGQGIATAHVPGACPTAPNDMLVPDSTTIVSGGYRYGFNGKEDDDETGWQDYGMRYYDRQIGRFISADPLIVYGQKYPELSSYQFASNSPIQAIDLDGLEATKHTTIKENGTSIYKTTDIYIRLKVVNNSSATAENIEMYTENAKRYFIEKFTSYDNADEVNVYFEYQILDDAFKIDKQKDFYVEFTDKLRGKMLHLEH